MPANPTLAEVGAREVPEWFNLVARKKLGAGEVWRWFRLERLKAGGEYTDDAMVTGAVPIGTTKNGDPKWPPASQCERIIVRDSEVQAAKDAWERETGWCSTCGGSGQQFAGWSAAEGRRTRDCGRCTATGNAPLTAIDAALAHEPTQEAR